MQLQASEQQSFWVYGKCELVLAESTRIPGWVSDLEIVPKGKCGNRQKRTALHRFAECPPNEFPTESEKNFCFLNSKRKSQWSESYCKFRWSLQWGTTVRLRCLYGALANEGEGVSFNLL